MKETWPGLTANIGHGMLLMVAETPPIAGGATVPPVRAWVTAESPVPNTVINSPGAMLAVIGWKLAALKTAVGLMKTPEPEYEAVCKPMVKEKNP